MRLLKTVLNQKALTLIELMISSLLLFIAFSGFLIFILNVQKQLILQDKKLALKTSTQSLFQGISANPTAYQKHYSCIKEGSTAPAGCVTEDSLLTYARLPFAVNNEGTLEPVATCVKCKNRVGYLLYYRDTDSLLKLVLRAASPTDIILNLKSFVKE